MSAPEFRRIRMTLQYDGGAFFGWQLQPAERTVQGELERVLERLFDRPTRVVGSGRTDRGVHALGQVAAVDAPLRWSSAELRRSLNALLPPDVWVESAEHAPDGFHPRYDAVSRAYVYRIGRDEATRSPFHRRWCWTVPGVLDEESMRRATGAIVGDHSFRAFAKAGQEERGDRCVVTRAEWGAWDEIGIEFHVAANRFLHHMVRYLVGTLVAVGRGERREAEMAEMLSGSSDLKTSPPAPPEGLFLREVRYRDE